MQLLSPGLGLILWLIVIILVILVIAALNILIKYSTLDANMKVMWLLIILFVPVIGSIMCFITGKSKKLKV